MKILIFILENNKISLYALDNKVLSKIARNLYDKIMKVGSDTKLYKLSNSQEFRELYFK